MDIRKLLARRTQGLAPSAIRRLVPLMRQPGMISFGGGYPHPGSFAFDTLEILFKSGKRFTVKDRLMELACQYGPTDAQADLKPHLLKWHALKDRVELEADQIQVTNGSQEGLHILGYLLLEEGDGVVISEPAYPGALGAFGAFTREFVSVPLDDQGMITEELERILEKRDKASLKRPKFIYEVPCGHNPAGVTLSLKRREHLLAVASRYDLLIVEDDPYQLVSLEEGLERLPTLQSLDREGRVVRLDSFSKIFAPGLRLGYASARPEIINCFQLYKQTTNLHTSAMVQAELAAFFSIHSGEEFLSLIAQNCRFYRENRDLMVACAGKYLPSYVKFNIPREGLFIWFELPPGFDAARMMEQDSLELKVLFVFGSAFSPGGRLKNFMRASFSMVGPGEIEEGMRRFAVMIKREEERVSPGI